MKPCMVMVCFSCFLLLAATLGCGSGTVPVSGTVTYKGKPVANVNVVFLGQAGAYAQGTTDAQGQFSQVTSREGDGATPGDYTVTIAQKTEVQDEDAGPVTYDYSVPTSPPPFPVKYLSADGSDVKVTIAKGAENKFQIELKD